MAEINNYNSRDNEADTPTRSKKFEAVAKGKRGKTSAIDRIYKIFIKEDLSDVKEAGILGVIIPSVKKTILDVINVFLHPDGKTSYTSNSVSKISYRNFYDNNDADRMLSKSSTVAAVGDFDSIVFDTRGEAEKVLAMMDEMMDTYHMISVADFYEICGVEDTVHTANKYGWKDIRSAKIVRTTYNQYQIKLPRVVPL